MPLNNAASNSSKPELFKIMSKFRKYEKKSVVQRELLRIKLIKLLSYNLLYFGIEFFRTKLMSPRIT